MNISTLSQQLNISVQELRQRMSKLGFKLSPRQRKIDNVAAKEILDKLKQELSTTVQQVAPTDPLSKKISIPPHITVKDLAALMRLPVVEVIKVLIKNGVMAAMNEQVDFDTASVVASDFGFEVEVEAVKSGATLGTGYVAEVIQKELADPKTASQKTNRPPIVAVMGHVDHGKTTFLDTLRKTNIASEEAGAITQHLGAYQVQHNNKSITFLDTPGHEAFTQMRARGANVTDLIVLVVAADDGVKPQTVEVINRARLASVPLIVAINKIDKPEANPDRVKQQLSEVGVLVEQWGGKVPALPISAKKGEGLNELLDMILLMSEVEGFRANPKGQVVGTVIESHVARGQGSVATVIVQNGTLRMGDFVVAGSAYGKIKLLENTNGTKVNQSAPSVPVRIFGLSELPQAGDIFKVVESLDEARSLARNYAIRERARKFLNPGIEAHGKTLNLIIKTDVQGSLEAIIQSLEELKTRTTEVQLTIIDSGVGQITETDVLRAESSNATILGFSSTPNSAALSLAKSKGVKIDLYNIIYELLEDVTRAIVAMLSPEIIRTIVGRAKILAIFRTDPHEQIIGGRLEEGKIVKNGNFVIKRGPTEVGSGKATELQRNKQSASEILSGSEFGLKVESTSKVLENDILEFYSEEIKSRQLDA